jgi:hypothetical protein
MKYFLFTDYERGNDLINTNTSLTLTSTPLTTLKINKMLCIYQKMKKIIRTKSFSLNYKKSDFASKPIEKYYA